MYRNLYDCHTHTDNSPDGLCPVRDIAQRMAELGIKGFSVTDHYDCDCVEQLGYDARIDRSYADTVRVREELEGKVEIAFGVELGEALHDLPGAENVLRRYPFDVVLGSIHHMLGGWGEFFAINYAGFSQEKIHGMLLQYFSELLELIRWGGFDVLAHLSLPLRYLKMYNNIDIDLRRYAAEIDEVLRALALSGKGLEINLSGLRRELRQTLPPAWAARRFRELGGKLVTLGTDSHRMEQLGSGIQEGCALLAEAGFTHYAFYRERKPRMIPLA